MEQQVIITTDLGYGDAGKGTMVDALVHKENIDLVVRYSGGAQAAHNVVTPNGRHHTFAQFGSGSFRPGTMTYLGPKVLVHPKLLLTEAAALAKLGVAEPLRLMHVDERAPVITPYHQLVNQIKELARGNCRHGSTGIGIGETRADSEDESVDHITAGDLRNLELVRAKLAAVREAKKLASLPLLQEHASNEAIIRAWHMFTSETLFKETLTSYEKLARQVHITGASFLRGHLRSGRRAIFEAAQGTLLDEDYGFFPYVTRGKVRDVHAHELLAEVGHTGRPYVLGITRAYAARHGPGPFPTENAWLRSNIHEAHNEHGQWQGAFRMGHFDLVATRYAIAVNKQVDGVAVTSLDQLAHLPWFYSAVSYVDATGRVHQNLGLPEAGNLEELAKRSEWLMEGTSPIYAQLTMNEPGLLNQLSEWLSRPVVATSSGMTREAKQFFPSAALRAA